MAYFSQQNVAEVPHDWELSADIQEKDFLLESSHPETMWKGLVKKRP
jgi:hypothetical protein